MARYFYSVRQVGEEACWLIVQQALGIPDSKMQSDFMEDRIALLLFTRQSLPERMCVTAAVRQMGGSTMYEGASGGQWREEMSSFQKHLLPIFAYYLDCMYLYGFPTANVGADGPDFPVINAGCEDAHPAHALADIACMLKLARYLKDVDAGWVGCPNGTLYSLIAATAWFPFNLRISMPPQVDATPIRAAAAGLNVSFVDSPQKAVQDARFIFAGKKPDFSNEDLSAWTITPELMLCARDDARLLLSASPVRAIPIAPSVLDSPASLLTRQADYRLRVHKRILHWVFEC